MSKLIASLALAAVLVAPLGASAANPKSVGYVHGVKKEFVCKDGSVLRDMTWFGGFSRITWTVLGVCVNHTAKDPKAFYFGTLKGGK